jgi:DNA-binding GntR family transcriptional regulator
VTESQLATAFGVGRAAVRAALGRLSQENLIVSIARIGHVVAPITIGQVRDVFDVRLQLEPIAVRRAAEMAPQLAELRKLEEACRAAQYLPGDDVAVDKFLRANTAFHVGIVAWSGNRLMTEMIGGLLESSERFFHLALSITDRNDEMYHEHHDLVEALADQAGQRAYDVAVDQIRASREMVMSTLLDSPELRDANLVNPDTLRASKLHAGR